jgi:hypothetical protein
MSGLNYNPPENAKIAYAVGIQALYERFQNGKVPNIINDLEVAASEGGLTNYVNAIPEVMRARGLSKYIPDGLGGGISSFTSKLQLTALITGSMFTSHEKAKLLVENLNHNERIKGIANEDPIVSLLQSD